MFLSRVDIEINKIKHTIYFLHLLTKFYPLATINALGITYIFFEKSV